MVLIQLYIYFLMPLAFLGNADIIEIRTQYYLAISNEKDARKLVELLENIETKSNLLKGYEGATKMLLAKHVFLPTQKFSFFNEGKSILEAAIAAEPSSLDLIFLRFGIQSSCPSFLRYNQNIEKDRKSLVFGVKQLKDRDLKNRILTFLISNVNLTEAERDQLK